MMNTNAVPMNRVEPSAGFKNDSLVDTLAQFIAVVDARVFVLKEQFESRRLSTPHDAGFAEEVPGEWLEGVCADLIREIRRLSHALTSTSKGLGQEMVGDLTYLMAAWADETLLQTFHESLPGYYKGAIERQLFGTMDAGEQIFAKISLLIGRRSQGDTALAAVYLLVLSLGFRGQYFGGQYQDQSHEVLVRYREELTAIALLAPKDHYEAPEGGEHLGLAAKEQSLSARHHQKMVLMGVFMAGVWLAAVIGAEVGWRVVMAPLKQALLAPPSVKAETIARYAPGSSLGERQ